MSNEEYSGSPRRRVTFNTSSDESYISKEAYKALRTNILFCGEKIKSIVITSTVASEGKSTVSSELAKSLSDSGKRTLLIDADLRKSTFLRPSQRNGEILGISEVLSGICEVEDAIYKTQAENFDVIFTGHFPPNPVELLGNGKLKEILDGYRNVYDYVIIDAPPLIPVIDAAVIAQSVDAAIIVLAPKQARRKNLIAVNDQLEKSGTRILGVVINETEKNKASYNKYEDYQAYH